MKSRIVFNILCAICLILLGSKGLSLQAQNGQQVPFKGMKPNDPTRMVINRVLNGKYSMQHMFSQKEWSSGHYKGAWERARQYFPNNFYYNTSTKYFMTHGFDSKGKLYMEVYQSKELTWAKENLVNFAPKNVVDYYQKIHRDNNESAIKDFKKKLGLLESYFANDKSHSQLKKMLGSKLYNQMMKTLQNEGYHMFAGALMHEGMHSKMDNDQKVAKIQQDFKTCKTPVQWDELRGYMAEVNYHSKYYRWAVRNINAHWSNIFKLLKDLERYRNKQKPLKQHEKDAIEKIKARIKAHIAMIRVHLREIQQSIDRMSGLMDYFKKNYVKANADKKYQDMINKMQADVSNFKRDAGKMINDMEGWLKDLESYLKLFNEWASCKQPTPPPKKDQEKIKKKVKDADWPTPPGKDAENIKRKAETEIGKAYIAGPNIPSSPTAPRSKNKSFVISAGGNISTTSNSELNDYIDYLNTTWNGDIGSMKSAIGFWIEGTVPVTDNFGISVEYESFNQSENSTLLVTNNDYEVETSLKGIVFNTIFKTNPFSSTVSLYGKFGAGYYMSDYTETEGDFVIDADDSGIGVKLGVGTEIGFGNGNTGLQLESGYRFVSSDNYDEEFFAPNDPPVEINNSGIFVKIGMFFKF
ncbi:hypothetical protein EYV94_04935 [Puteibacter caeruleilacunae]|nr:hypothetical protein EYV94_04935 [Puteibacter caeruleilacunae]